MKQYFSILVLLSLSGCFGKKAPELVSPIVAPITEAVFAPGQLEARNQFTLTAISEGYLRKSLVQEGDLVKERQILFVQDNTNAVIQQRSTAQNMRISQKNAADDSPVLLQLNAQLQSAQQKRGLDEIQLQRMKRLYATRSVSKVELDNAQLSYDNSENTVRSIRENIAATKLSLEQALISSKSQYETAVSNASYFNLKSTGNFKVYKILKKEGDMLKKGDPIALLGESEKLVVSLNVDESSISKVRRGQMVLVEMNTEKEKAYQAVISKIYPYFDENTQSFIVEATFSQPTTGVIAGTLIQANIIIGKKEKALLIPRSSLNGNGQVMLATEKKFLPHKIKTGIVSSEWVEVKDGLTVDDRIQLQY